MDESVCACFCNCACLSVCACACMCVCVYLAFGICVYAGFMSMCVLVRNVHAAFNTLQLHHTATLQHATTHHNTIQHVAALGHTLQHTATHCNTLQHTATHGNTRQHTATQRNVRATRFRAPLPLFLIEESFSRRFQLFHYNTPVNN